MGTLFVDKLDPQSGTSLELGSSGDTITIPSGATIANSGTATGFGETNTPIFLATLGSTQNSISRSTQTKITYAAEVIDSDNAFDTSTNRFTVPSGKGGKYMFIVSASAQMPSYDPQAIMTSLYKNGSQVAFHQYYANEADYQNDQDNTQPLVTIQNLAAGDYVEGYIWMYQADGGTGNIQVNNGSFFQGYRITS